MEKEKNSGKIVFIDYLKAIGLLLIILAHSSCDNQLIMNLRIFDVPLMVILSGFLAYDSYKRSVTKGENIISYYKKRVIRLLIPTWIFLSIYFCIVGIFSLKSGFPYSFNEIIRSYLLLDGIGYVWIIRIYLICALITPLIVKLVDGVKNKYYLFIAFILLYTLHELMISLNAYNLNMLFEFVIAYTIPYGIIYFLGLLSNRIKNKYYDFIVSGVFMVVFVIMLVMKWLESGEMVSMQTAKYPPSLYYISYSLFIGFLLLGILKRIKLKEIVAVKFLSRSSLWIYLWHILIIYFVYKLHIDNWLVNYVLILCGASVIAFIQNKIVDYLGEKKIVNEKILAVFRG